MLGPPKNLRVKSSAEKRTLSRTREAKILEKRTQLLYPKLPLTFGRPFQSVTGAQITCVGATGLGGRRFIRTMRRKKMRKIGVNSIKGVFWEKAN